MKNFFLKSSLFYFFYKILKILRNSKRSMHLGEFGEDIFVRRFFKNYKKGTYVDVGSYHPIKGSLTYNLYKKNWSGINIDLSKISVDLFKISRSQDINLRAAITDYDGKTFYYENSPINQQNSMIENSFAKKIEIDCFKLNTVLDKYQIKKIDYLNIDAEGNDFKVISTFDFERFKPALVTIEFNSYDFDMLLESDIHTLMKNNGYKLISKFGVTCFYVQSKTSSNVHEIMRI